MSKSLIDKLAARLRASCESDSDLELSESFSQLSDIDLDSISAAHTSDHGSVHYSQPSPTLGGT